MTDLTNLKEKGRYIWKEGFKLAQLWSTSMQIANLSPNSKFFGGVQNCNINSTQLEKLINLGVINLKDKQNNAPTIRSLYKLSKYFNKEIIFECYFVEPNRDDCRISIEGVWIPTIEYTTPLLKRHYKQILSILKQSADEFETTENLEYRFWWD